jgi:hypothetical protein
MAKKQTFDAKGKGSDLISVKVLKWYQDENRDTLRLLTKLIKVKDLNELQKIEINK